MKRPLNIQPDFAICYSGYRENQSPRTQDYPTYEQIVEDLAILKGNWKFLRLYDCSKHAELVLEAIDREKLDFKIMLGADIGAEVNNPGCPWMPDIDDQILAQNRSANSQQIDRLIELCNQYPEIIFSASIGNEASVEWTDHMVPVESLLSYAKRVRQSIKQPVTFCENYVPWTNKLMELAEELDFISLHTYPVWEYKHIDEALAYTQANYEHVAHHHPGKTIVITEAGWTTQANNKGIEAHNASRELQTVYHRLLQNWARENNILTFVFEAFDEPWKGSDDPIEPEKHWGIYTVDRQPKPVVSEVYETDFQHQSRA